MPRPTLAEPIDRWTIQARLTLTDKQWDGLDRHLTRYEGPDGLTVYDWRDVVSTLRRITHPSPWDASKMPAPIRIRGRAVA